MALWALAGLAIGCSEPLLEPDHIERTRVLAARAEVDGEPERAWPRPGEAVAVRWFVVDPGAARPLGWMLSACIAEGGASGRPVCVGAPLAVAATGAPEIGEPRIVFETPDAAAFEGGRRLAITGVVCPETSPVVRGSWPDHGCTSGEVGTRVSLELEVERDGVANHNPSLADDRVELDGAEWTAPPVLAADPAGCAGEPASSALPLLRADGGGHSVRIVLSGDDREALPPSDVGDAREELQVSHFTTQGDLDGTFAVVEASDSSASPEIRLEWTMPGEAPPEGVRARFYVVTRDLRGGADWTTREACLVP